MLQDLRNVGSTCRFVMPTHIVVSNPTAGSRTFRLLAVRHANSRFPHGAVRQLMIGASWPYSHSAPPRDCGHPFVAPSAVQVPVGTWSLRIPVPGLWREICASPFARVPTAELTLHSH